MTLLTPMKISQTKASSKQNKPILHDELITEILSWLPVKALARLKCVCKSLNTLISDPFFVNLHLQRSTRNVHLVQLYKFQTEFIMKSFLPPYFYGDGARDILFGKCNYYSVVGSCNGLICLYNYSCTPTFRELRLCLWNPATRLTWENLPSLQLSDADEYFSFAFGYDNITTTYKVVAYQVVVLSSFDEVNDGLPERHVKVLSIGGDNYWRSIRNFPIRPLNICHNDGVHFSSALNWLAIQDRAGSDRCGDITAVDELMILSLDLVSETYRQLQLPHGFDEVPHMEEAIAIGVLKDCLCLSHDSKRTHLVIWLMKEFGIEESWTQFLKISYEDLLTGLMPEYIESHDFQLFPLFLSEKDDALIVTMTDEEDRTMVYKWRDNRGEGIVHSIRSYSCSYEDYFESLVWPC